nr:ComF family protein [Myroides pelagicus]
MACNTLLLQNEEILCTTCRSKLSFTNQHLHQDNLASQKFYGRINIEHASCLLFFKKRTGVQNILHNLKYKNHPEISYYLGMIYAEQLKQTSLLHRIDSIIMVPLHPSKQRKRGYNQVSGFAQAIHEVYGIPIEENLLIKTKKTKAQANKKLFDRLKKTTKPQFVLNPKATTKSQHFLLIDDILTTGNTLEQCAKELLKLPNSKVTILCLAMTTESF